jgi:hypothetical protein
MKISFLFMVYWPLSRAGITASGLDNLVSDYRWNGK